MEAFGGGFSGAACSGDFLVSYFIINRSFSVFCLKIPTSSNETSSLNDSTVLSGLHSTDV